MKINKSVITLLVLIILGLSIKEVYAQHNLDSIQFAILPIQDTVGLGTDFEVSFQLLSQKRNCKVSNVEITAPSFDDFEIVSGPSVFFKTLMTNGAYKSEKTFTYTLRSDKTGLYEIGPASIQIAGQPLETEAIQIFITDEFIANRKATREDVFIKAFISNNKAFIGQALTLEYRLFLPENLELHRHQIDSEDEYRYFRHTEEGDRYAEMKTENIDGVSYKSRVLKQVVLYPQLTGEWEISPLISTLFIRTLSKEDESAFSSYRRDYEEIKWSTERLNIEVVGYPDDIPDDFKGAVDCKNISMEIRDSISVNNTMEIGIVIGSTGDVDRIYWPSLGLPEWFEKEHIYAIEDSKKEHLKYANFYERRVTYRFNTNVLAFEDFKPSLSYFDSKIQSFTTLSIDASELLGEKSVQIIEDSNVDIDKEENEAESNTEALDLILAIDISSSMLTRDFEPDRLGFLKDVLINKLPRQVQNQRTGVLVFNAVAKVISPLITKKNSLSEVFNQIEIGGKNDGTSFEAAMVSAINVLEESSSKNKAIILITDGQHNANGIDPLIVAAIARRLGIKIFTIGVNSDRTALAPVSKRPSGAFVFDMVPQSFAEEQPREIADLTGGQFYRLTDADQFTEIMKEIQSLAALPVKAMTHEILETVERQTNEEFDLWLNMFEAEVLKEMNY